MCLLLRIPTLFGIRGGSKWTRFFAYMAFPSHITVRVLLAHWPPNAFAFLVGPSGLEPPTSRLSGVRSNLLSYGPVFGGDEENRTPDPLLARQVLSQLSYTPILASSFAWVS